MMAFMAAKAEYDALPPDAPRDALHEKHAKTALDFALTHRGVYIKAGQFIASLQGGAGERAIPSAYVRTLQKLTDDAPTVPLADVAAVFEADIGPIAWSFDSVDEQPVAAGSLAQVHRALRTQADAELFDGTTEGLDSDGQGSVPGTRDVAVKIQFPGLDAQVAADLEALRMMAAMMTTDVGWLLDDITRHITTELDFRIEAQNARAAHSALMGSFLCGHLSSPPVAIPAPIPHLCSSRVLCTPFLPGLVRLDDAAALARIGVRGEDMGDYVCRAFGMLSLVYGLVHGDPHAGNVYATGSHNYARLVILDHALYHRLTDGDRLAFCELILACARPFPSRTKVRRLAERFAGPLWPLFPLLLSPLFALATPLNVDELRDAAAARLPARVSLDDVWQALEAMHSSDSDVIGLLHHLGYVRGLCSMTGLSERRRVKILVRCATIAGQEAWWPVADRSGSMTLGQWLFVGLRESLALWAAALRVELLVLLLRSCALVLELWGAVLAAAS